MLRPPAATASLKAESALKLYRQSNKAWYNASMSDKKYIITSGESLLTLLENVNQYMANGYVPTGGVCLTYGGNTYPDGYCQALVKT